jgi:hypothetical protein
LSLVEYDDVAVRETSLSVLHVEEEAGERVRLNARLLVEDRGRHRRGRDPDEVVAGALPSLARRVEGAGLPRPRRADEQRDPLASNEEIVHGAALVLAECGPSEHDVHGAARDYRGLRIEPVGDTLEDASLGA